MLIYVVDDEANMLYLLHEAVIEAVPDTEIRDFSVSHDLDWTVGEGKLFCLFLSWRILMQPGTGELHADDAIYGEICYIGFEE